jgi:CheY-like chemotaxis protein
MAAVLLLEDDRGIRRYMALALLNAGYAVIDTGDPHDAIQMLSGEAPFDLLISENAALPAARH